MGSTVGAVTTLPSTHPGEAAPVLAAPAGAPAELLEKVADTVPDELAVVLEETEEVAAEGSFYRLADRSLTDVEGVEVPVEQVESTRWTAGRWDPGAQHGGPPAALLIRRR